MTNSDNLLSRLNDIHLPADPGIWPPAPGWWILLFACLLLLAIAGRTVLKLQRKKHPVKTLIRSLDELSINPADVPGTLYRISRLVRQYAIHRFGRETVSPLQGESWIALLDTTTRNGTGFSGGCGNILGTGMYRDNIDINLEELRNFLIHWAREQKI